mgnify:CR=1 FL=1
MLTCQNLADFSCWRLLLFSLAVLSWLGFLVGFLAQRHKILPLHGAFPWQRPRKKDKRNILLITDLRVFCRSSSKSLLLPIRTIGDAFHL